MSSLLLLGAGGHAKVIAEAALASGLFCNLAFLDDRWNSPDLSSLICGFPVIGPLSIAFDPDVRKRFPFTSLAMGNPTLRLQWFDRLHSQGFQFPVIIHPSAWVSPSAKIGPASVVFAQSVIQSDVTIGRAVIVNTGSSVDHDATVGNYVHICPGARLAGDVHIGHRTLVGIGASVIQRIHIGSDVTIGAGAAVIYDIPDGVTAVGVPARVLTTSSSPS